MVALFECRGLHNPIVLASTWRKAWTEGWSCRQELPGKLGDYWQEVSRRKRSQEAFGDVTVTPREALDHHPYDPSAARYCKTWPKAFKTPGFPNPPLVTLHPTGQPLGLHTHTHSSCKEDCLRGGGVEWDGMGIRRRCGV